MRKIIAGLITLDGVVGVSEQWNRLTTTTR
jgi:hypothetical protein